MFYSYYFQIIMTFFYFVIKTEQICLGFNKTNNSCLFCNFDSFLSTAEPAPFDFSLCILKTQHHSVFRNVLVLNSSTHLQNVPQIMFDSIYTNFTNCLFQENYVTVQNYYTKLTIHLARGTFSFYSSDQNFKYFRRNLVELTIKPLDCNDYNINNLCLKSTEKIIILLKSQFLFYISQSLLFENIIFDGSDVALSSIPENSMNNVTLKLCKSSNFKCCSNYFFNNVFNDSSPNIQNLCGLKKKINFTNTNQLQGIFNLEVILDVVNVVLPEISIIKCTFINFILFQNNILTFFLANKNGQILIANSSFENMFAMKGFFSSEDDVFGPKIYKNTIGENNTQNETLRKNLLTMSFFNMTKNILTFFDTSYITFQNQYESTIIIILFEFKHWMANSNFLEITLNNMSSSSMIEFVLFFSKFNFLTIEKLQVYNFTNFQFLSAQISNVSILHLSIFNSSQSNNLFFEIYSSNVYFSSMNVSLFFNIFAKEFIYCENSPITLSKGTFNFLLNFSAYFLNCASNFTHMSFENSTFKGEGFFYQNQYFYLQNISLINIISESQIFTLSLCDSATISQSVFWKISTPIFIKPLKLKSFVFLNNLFSNSTIDYFISPNSILFSAFLTRSIFTYTLSKAFFFSLLDFIHCQIVENYFFKTSHLVDDIITAFQIFDGFFLISGCVFENIFLKKEITWFFDIELCFTQTINSTFIFTDIPYIPSGNSGGFLGFWQTLDTYIDNVTFVIESCGFAYGMIEAMDATTIFFLRNSNFITLNKNDQNHFHYSEAIHVSGCPSILIEDNFISNMRCPIGSTDINKIVGPICFEGVPSFSSVSNDFTLKFINNIIINCSCFYGGSVGILNYNNTFIQNITIFNSDATYGGSFYLANCFEVYIDKTIIKGSRANKGAAVYLQKNHYFSLTDAIFQEIYGFSTGAIHAILMEIGYIYFCSFFNTFSENMGGSIYLNGGNLEIFRTSFENTTALQNGGGIFLANFANLSILNSYSNNSFCSIDGGFIYAQSIYKLSLKSIVLIQSKSNFRGGCLFLNSFQNFSLNNVSLIENEAKLNGIIFVDSLEKSPLVIFVNIKCIKNKAMSGSCIFYSNPTDLSIVGINCFGNDGTIMMLGYVYVMNVYLKSGNFSNNFAATSIFAMINVKVSILNFYFFNNSICLAGLSFENSEVFMNNLTFSHAFVFFCNSANQPINSISSRLLLNIAYFESSAILQKFNILTLINLKKSLIEITEAVFKNYVFLTLDGLISSEDSEFYIEKILFVNNSGPLFKSLNSNLTINLSYFENNIGGVNQESANDFFLLKQQTSFNNFCFFQCLNNIFKIRRGLSILVSALDEVNFSNCGFFGSSNNSNAINFQNIISTKIELSCFFNLKSFQGSAINFETTVLLKTKFSLKNSKIFNCKNYYGGAIFISSIFIDIFIFNNEFLNNQALYNDSLQTGRVGVLSFCNILGNSSTFLLSQNIFKNNIAEIFPTLYSNIYVNETSNIYTKNTDQIKMTNTSSYPKYRIILTKMNSFNSSDDKIFNISSGMSFKLVISIVDALNQSVIYDNSSSSSILIPQIELNTSKVKKMQNNFAIATRGEHLFEKLLVYATPKTIFNLEIKILFFDIFKTKFTLKKLINFQTRACILGEVVNFDFSCLQCPVNSYSLIDPHFEGTGVTPSCKICLINAFCPGGHVIIPKNGFWRISPNSLYLALCLVDNYCIGSNVTQDTLISNLSLYENNSDLQKGLCALGHQGNLCHECIHGFGKYTTNALCEPCKDYTILAIIRLAIFVLILVVYLFLNSKSILTDKESSLLSEVSKIYINHIQKVSMILLFNIQSMVDAMKKFQNFLSTFNFLTQDIFSNDCFIQLLVEENQQYDFYILKVFITMTLPIIIAIISVFLILTIRTYLQCIRRDHTNQRFLSRIVLIFLIAVFLFYPLITKSSLSLLNCIKIDESGDQYMYNSPNLLCWSSTHFFYFYFFGMMGIVLFGVGYPLALFLMIWSQKRKFFSKKFTNITFIFEKQHEDKVSKKTEIIKMPQRESTVNAKMVSSVTRRQAKFLFFFYKEYKNNCFFWETVIFFQKLLLTLLPNLNELIAEEIKEMLFFVILFVYLSAVFCVFPFRREYINWLEINSIVTNILTKLFLIFFLSNNINSQMRYIFMIFQFIVNISFFIHMAFIIIKYTNWSNLFHKSLKEITRIKRSLGILRKKFLFVFSNENKKKIEAQISK